MAGTIRRVVGKLRPVTRRKFREASTATNKLRKRAHALEEAAAKQGLTTGRLMNLVRTEEALVQSRGERDTLAEKLGLPTQTPKRNRKPPQKP